MVKKATLLFWEQLDEQLKQNMDKESSPFIYSYVNNEVIIYVTKCDEQTLDSVRMLAGNISRYVQKNSVNAVHLSSEQLVATFNELEREDIIVSFVEGWHLGAYQFDKYKTKKVAPMAELQFEHHDTISDFIVKGTIRAAATAFSRDLMNELSTELNPETFPTILKDAYKHLDIDVVVHNKATLEQMEMNGLLAVNRGSQYDPAFIELHYEGDSSKPLITLVGKGVTFDTGGISLKSGRNISDMRMDMGGAAAVAGAMKLLAESKAKVNVVGLIQTVENIPDRYSILPGEIITYKNGKTVQVGNTDAEGRLILADGLIRAGELGAEHIVDIATLTGAIGAALGPKLGGIFGEETLTSTMKEIGEKNGEFVWPMPLVDDYDKTLSSPYADFSNISTQAQGGSITAALFLRRFVPENAKWIHVDMAGVMESKEHGYYSDSATGFGARLLADYAMYVSNEH